MDICRDVNIVLLINILLKREKNYDCSFLVKKRFFPNVLHGNNIICTVECIFRLIIDVPSLKIF